MAELCGGTRSAELQPTLDSPPGCLFHTTGPGSIATSLRADQIEQKGATAPAEGERAALGPSKHRTPASRPARPTSSITPGPQRSSEARALSLYDDGLAVPRPSCLSYSSGA